MANRAPSCRVSLRKTVLNFADYTDDLARAMGFLSRISMPKRFFVGHDGSLSRTVQAFPLAGILIGLPVAACFGILTAMNADPVLAAFLALGLQALVTGCLHEDGLCDMADGFGGGRTRDSILTIMRDSRIGTYGAVALILSFGIRVSALASLAGHLTPFESPMLVLAVAAISRTAMVWHWSATAPARTDGVAASSGAPEEQAALIAYGTCAAACILLLWPAAGLLASVVAAGAVAGLVQAHSRYVTAKIGGHTGDTIGASQQISEIAAFSALALLV